MRADLLADQDWLRRRYLDDQLSLRQIAVQAQCSPASVRFALATAGIPTRPPGRRSARGSVDEEHILDLVAVHGQAGAADELGIDPKTLYREARRLGIATQMRDAMRTHRRWKNTDPASDPDDTVEEFRAPAVAPLDRYVSVDTGGHHLGGVVETSPGTHVAVCAGCHTIVGAGGSCCGHATTALYAHRGWRPLLLAGRRAHRWPAAEDVGPAHP